MLDADGKVVAVHFAASMSTFTKGVPGFCQNVPGAAGAAAATALTFVTTYVVAKIHTAAAAPEAPGTFCKTQVTPGHRYPFGQSRWTVRALPGTQVALR